MVFYGYKTLSLILRQEHRRCLRTGCSAKYLMVEELTRSWRKIHKEELHHWYFSFKYNYHVQNQGE